MTEPREFELGAVLTITEGSFVAQGGIEAIYDILNYMTGDSLFTHQLPRAAIACEGPLLEQHPQLAGVKAPVWREDVKAHVDEWVAEMKALYGDTLPVVPLVEWHHMDPLQELADDVAAWR